MLKNNINLDGNIDNNDNQENFKDKIEKTSEEDVNSLDKKLCAPPGEDSVGQKTSEEDANSLDKKLCAPPGEDSVGHLIANKKDPKACFLLDSEGKVFCDLKVGDSKLTLETSKDDLLLGKQKFSSCYYLISDLAVKASCLKYLFFS